MKIRIILFICCLSALNTLAQQELQVSQYMFNQLMVNPAYTGTHDYGSASLLYRTQWTTIDAAPISQVASLETPLKNNIVTGAGLLITNDSHGIIDELSVMANLSRKFKLNSKNTTLSLAIRGGVSTYSANFNNASFWDENDPIYSSNNLSNELVPKFGFGAYVYDQLWYAGISIPTILAAGDDKLLVTTSSGNYFEQHFYATGGYIFNLSPILDLRPSALIKYENAAPLEADINVNFLLNKKLWLGLGYRTGDAIIGMVEYNFSNKLRAGYSYDFTTSALAAYNNGSHEIMLSFDFGEDVIIKKTSPRYF